MRNFSKKSWLAGFLAFTLISSPSQASLSVLLTSPAGTFLLEQVKSDIELEEEYLHELKEKKLS